MTVHSGSSSTAGKSIQHRRKTIKVVNRRTFIIKRGHLQEAVELLKREASDEIVHRIYVSHYGPFDNVVLDVEFNSVTEMEQIWTNWFASESAQAFGERWAAITETGGSNEVWFLH